MKKKQLLSVNEYMEGIKVGNRFILGQAITLVESNKQEHRTIARQLISKCQTTSVSTFRVGITGSPGVGKSTFIESLGIQLIEAEKKLAVLTIDPSSQLTKGSILGDKTRMNKLAASENAFIRPSPSGSTLGGVARNTKETMLLCEAAGYDYLFVETVGVGQSEIAVHYLTDLFLLLLLPGAGDELQGIKKGVVEMADLLIVNKSDGDRKQLAEHTRRAYMSALKMFPGSKHNHGAQIMTCSALDGSGMNEVQKFLEDYRAQQAFIKERRLKQEKYWLRQAIETGLRSSFFDHPNLKAALEKEEKSILDGKTSPFEAAERLLNLYKKKK